MYDAEARAAEHRRLVAARIRAARTALGLSQRALARRMGASTPTLVTHWELGRGYPTLTHQFAVAAALGMPVGELFGYDLGGPVDHLFPPCAAGRCTECLGQCPACRDDCSCPCHRASHPASQVDPTAPSVAELVDRLDRMTAGQRAARARAAEASE